MANNRAKNNNKILIQQEINPETHTYLYMVKLKLKKTLGDAIDFVVEEQRKLDNHR